MHGSPARHTRTSELGFKPIARSIAWSASFRQFSHTRPIRPGVSECSEIGLGPATDCAAPHPGVPHPQVEVVEAVGAALAP
jgi:hypothetical protein